MTPLSLLKEKAVSKRVFGYIRRSIENDNLSLQAQEKSIKAFAESQGWELLSIFCDSSESGRTLHRPEFQRMMNMLLSGVEADLILVPKLDRISRSLKDILILIEDRLDPIKIGLKSVTESFDSTTAEGRLLLSLLGGFAEFERKRIVERMMDGKYQLAENGGFTGGHIPYGYLKHPIDRGLFPDPKNSKIIYQLFNLFAYNGWSSQKLIIETGCPLHRDSVSAILSNPLYAGLIDYDGELSKGAHQPLVSVRLFNKVQEMKLLKARSTLSLFKVHGTSKIPLTFKKL